jgi:hypothetical protein
MWSLVVVRFIGDVPNGEGSKFLSSQSTLELGIRDGQLVAAARRFHRVPNDRTRTVTCGRKGQSELHWIWKARSLRNNLGKEQFPLLPSPWLPGFQAQSCSVSLRSQCILQAWITYAVSHWRNRFFETGLSNLST